ncbi:MAG: cupin domain-containing protein [Candidatus Omnitrophica bacterium]|nr:cupin domain-containing protein [Candidatus Omnitrophota bacterium]
MKQWCMIAAIAFMAGFLLGKMFNPVNTNAQSSIQENASSFTLDNCVMELSEDAIQKNDRGWAFWFVPQKLSGGLNLKMSEVNARTAHHGAHSHPEAEIYFILEGAAEFTLDGRSKIVGKNSSLYCPPNLPHGIRNAGDAPMRYLVIKSG